jgi:hypothetical protein
MSYWDAREEIFNEMPRRSYIAFCLGVACTFASIGVVTDLFDFEHSDTLHLVLKVLTTAGFAVLWTVVIQRRRPRLLVALAAVQVVWLITSAQMLPSGDRHLPLTEWRTHVAFDGLLIMIFVLFSYGWFGTFFRIEGKRYIAAHTEIELASRIQKQLVPRVEVRTGEFEAYGVSLPSGTVGGDLVDAVDADGTICAYVADVAGHGVAAGVLMSMVKTAVRMHLMTRSQSGEGLLEAVNATLTPLTDSSAYATFAYVLVTSEAALTYCVAAHPPIFHFRRKSGVVQRHSVENLPVAMFPGTAYETATIDFEEGDILAIVTDGLIEVFDAKGQELGDGYIESALTRLASLPLSEISDGIFTSAKRFGKVTDDQSLLLLRRCEAGMHQHAA